MAAAPRSKTPLARFVRSKWFTLLALLGTLPFLLLSVLVIGGSIFASAFVVEIRVENRSGEAIVVTPIGTSGPEGRRRPLPVMRTRLPAIPASQLGGFELAAGESVAILYDWDDTNLSELVVTDAEGNSRQLVIDPEPTANQYHPPTQTHFVIEQLDNLDPLDDAVLAAAIVAQRWVPFPIFLMLLLLAPWLALLAWWWLRRTLATHP